ncbi:MAG: DUF1385 domain-containing protein [Lachnospiraceae bacterium]
MKRTYIGGQAVMEGVMMKNQNLTAIAVRKPNGEIVVDKKKTVSFAEKHKWARLPLIRGVVNFVESLVVGSKALTFSTDCVLEGIDEEEETPGKFEQFLTEKLGDKFNSVIMGVSMTLGIILAVAIFMVLPYGLVSIFSKHIHSYVLLSAVEGIVRLMIFFTYMFLISRMKDIQRVFMYHGAEHKTINCLEAGDDLTVENVRKHTRLHKRCGTSFLLFVMLISIIVFMFVRVSDVKYRILFRVLLVPVIAGLSYEVIRLAGKSDHPLVSWLSKPGLMLQKLSTAEPDDSMIEVAIRSVEEVLDWRAYLEAERNGELED